LNRLIPRIRNEYVQWPRLSLTLAQGARLWNVDEQMCLAAFRALMVGGFLTVRGGRFARRDQAYQHSCPSCRLAS